MRVLIATEPPEEDTSPSYRALALSVIGRAWQDLNIPLRPMTTKRRETLSKTQRSQYEQAYSLMRSSIAFFAGRTKRPHDQKRSLVSLWAGLAGESVPGLYRRMELHLEQIYGPAYARELIDNAWPFRGKFRVRFDQIPAFWFDLRISRAYNCRPVRRAFGKKRASQARVSMTSDAPDEEKRTKADK